MHSVGHKFMARTTQKRCKSEMHTLEHGIW